MGRLDRPFGIGGGAALPVPGPVGGIGAMN